MGEERGSIVEFAGLGAEGRVGWGGGREEGIEEVPSHKSQ